MSRLQIVASLLAAVVCALGAKAGSTNSMSPAQPRSAAPVARSSMVTGRQALVLDAIRIRGGATTRPQASKVPAGGAIKAMSKPPPGTMSQVGSIFSLTKNIIGAGMLALPAGMAAGKGTGFGPAIGLVLFSCLSSAYTFSLVSRVVDVTGARDFRELWSLTIGEKSAGLVDIMIIGVAAGCLLVYSCFLGELLSSLSGGRLSRTGGIATTSGILLPLCLMPDLSALAPSSYIGMLAVIYSAIFVGKRFLDGTYAEGGVLRAALSVAPDLEKLSMWRVSLGTCTLFNMLSTAFMAHTNAVRFYNELEDRSVPRMNLVTVVSFIMTAAIYATVMMAGFSTFGGVSQGLVLSNYAKADPWAKIARAATEVSILGSYPLLFTSFRDVVISTLRASKSAAVSAFGNSASVNSSTPWRLLSVAMLGLFSALAVVTDDVRFVVSVSGASVGAGLIFCVPSLLFLATKRLDDADVLKTSKFEVSMLHCMFAFGIVAALFGTVVTVLQFYTTLLD